MTFVMPSIGTSLFLITLGAILRYAVTIAVTGVALRTIGLILMVVGGVGLVISVAFLLVRGRGSSTATHTDQPRERVVEREHYYEQ
jgi:uncharacterized protein DUF6458